ncbi:TPA: DinI family protein [Citrobacter freundii]|nr:DinI family protein [Citrobacter freundii]
MKIELTINKSKDLPRRAIPALEKELLKRLQNQYENCSLVIRRAGGDSLTVFGGDKGDKTKVEEILQETWEQIMQRCQKPQLNVCCPWCSFWS